MKTYRLVHLVFVVLFGACLVAGQGFAEYPVQKHPVSKHPASKYPVQKHPAQKYPPSGYQFPQQLQQQQLQQQQYPSQGYHQPPNIGRPPGFNKMNLSDEALKSMQEQMIRHRLQKERLKLDLRMAQSAFRRQELEDNPSMAELRKRVEEISRIRRDMDMERLNWHQELRSIMGPNQFQMWMLHHKMHKGKQDSYPPSMPWGPQPLDGHWKKGPDKHKSKPKHHH